MKGSIRKQNNSSFGSLLSTSGKRMEETSYTHLLLTLSWNASNIQAKETRRVSLSAIALVTGALVIEGFTLTGTIDAPPFSDPVAISSNNNTNSIKGSVLSSQKASRSGISIANVSLKTSSVSKKSPQTAKSRMLCYDMVMPVEILSVARSDI